MAGGDRALDEQFAGLGYQIPQLQPLVDIGDRAADFTGQVLDVVARVLE